MLLNVCLLSTCSCDPTIPMFIMGKQHFPWKYLLLAGDCQNCVFCWFIDSYFCISTTILIKSLALLPGNFPYHAEKPSLYRNVPPRLAPHGSGEPSQWNFCVWIRTCMHSMRPSPGKLGFGIWWPKNNHSDNSQLSVCTYCFWLTKNDNLLKIKKCLKQVYRLLRKWKALACHG